METNKKSACFREKPAKENEFIRWKILRDIIHSDRILNAKRTEEEKLRDSMEKMRIFHCHERWITLY